jgi:hypothetical protein
MLERGLFYHSRRRVADLRLRRAPLKKQGVITDDLQAVNRSLRIMALRAAEDGFGLSLCLAG